MNTTQLPDDFREFLRLLDDHDVRYLIVGGYAVGFHGYPRSTGDMDVWVQTTSENADRLVEVLEEFGFDVPELDTGLFLEPDRVIRMGHPPLRIELLTSVSGVGFSEAFRTRVQDTIDEIPVCFIGLEKLKENKRASGRHKDLNDLEHLP
ncbi:MAG: hypothetical protein ABEK75_11640 [Salinibacter sp.]